MTGIQKEMYFGEVQLTISKKMMDVIILKVLLPLVKMAWFALCKRPSFDPLDPASNLLDNINCTKREELDNAIKQ
jgi:hypothetical protein